MVRHLAVLGALALLVVACSESRQRPAPAAKPTIGGARSVKPGNPIDPADLPPEKPDEYIPAEFKSGADRWRDTGIYLDGKPIGMLVWAELPLALEPVFVDVKKSANKRADHPEELGWRMGKERQYRFTDYLRAIGIDPAKVREIHVYGPRPTQTIIATGKDLTSPAAEGFRFRFGGEASGKAIPVTPPDFGNRVTADKISAVAIYIEKQPPRLDRDAGMFLGDVKQDGIPYFGEPLRGGVRVYLDGRLAAYIKRQDLPVAQATADANGELSWNLYAVLAGQGVDTAKIAEAWIIRDERWQERLGRDELASITFTAGAQAKGKILLGPKALRVQSLVLETQPLDPARVPRPVEDDK